MLCKSMSLLGLRGENNFKHCVQNRILVSHWGSFKNFRRALLFFYRYRSERKITGRKENFGTQCMVVNFNIFGHLFVNCKGTSF